VRLTGLEVEELRELQFSRQKAEYIIGIAREFLQQGEVVKETLAGLADTSDMLDRLMRFRGVGEWTANYVLMKSLRRMDCITFGDAGLQSALSSLLELNRKPVRSEVEAFFEPFRGWESYLVIYLWRTLS
jgi:DNA-3-methyladenine glycosylase II